MLEKARQKRVKPKLVHLRRAEVVSNPRTVPFDNPKGLSRVQLKSDPRAAKLIPRVGGAADAPWFFQGRGRRSRVKKRPMQADYTLRTHPRLFFAIILPFPAAVLLLLVLIISLEDLVRESLDGLSDFRVAEEIELIEVVVQLVQLLSSFEPVRLRHLIKTCSSVEEDRGGEAVLH